MKAGHRYPFLAANRSVESYCFIDSGRKSIHRKMRFRILLGELHDEGFTSLVDISQTLGVSLREVETMLRGGVVGDEVAREIEWAMHRRKGWLDAYDE